MHTRINRTLVWLTAFSIAMGVLEAAVVVYLRKLYFPSGFQFPLAVVGNDIAIVELWREIATVVMLASVGALAGRNRGERFACFLYAFGIWDLVYYIGLFVFIGWPPSLLTWDILFLLPVPWVGPVLAPCIVAMTMIAVGATVVRHTTRGIAVDMTRPERALLWIGALVVIVSFTLDWTQVSGAALWRNITSDRKLYDGIGNYVPHHFNWWIFWLGEAMILAALVHFRSRLTRLEHVDTVIAGGW